MRRILGSIAVALVLWGCGGGGSGGTGTSVDPPPPPPPPTSCKATIAECTSPTECCGSCSFGFCVPSSQGGKCATSVDCGEPYLCVNRICATASCRQDLDVCAADAECCGGNCRGNRTCGANRPPVAEAGSDATIDRGVSVTLGGLSSDPDGDPLTFTWRLTAPAGSGSALCSSTTSHPTFVPDVAGPYTVSVTVSDGLTSASDSATLSAVNTAPVALAGANHSVARNQPAQLDATGSSDVNGDPVSFTWTLAGPAASTAALSSTTDPKPTFTPDLLGDYVITLVATDGDLSSSTSLTLTAINTPPVARITGFSVVNSGEAVTLSASTSTDPNGDPLTFTWSLSPPVGSGTTLASTEGETTSFVTDLEGPYTVTLSASDGADAHSASLQVDGAHRVASLPHDVVDAAYVKVGDRLVMLSTSPRNSLWILDPATEAEAEVALPSGPPLSVSVSPDGAVAVVGRWGAVTAVDLATATVTKDCPVTWLDGTGVSQPLEAASVAAGAPVNFGTAKNPAWNRFAFTVAGESAGGGENTHSVNLGTCATTITAGPLTATPKMAALRPGTTTLYVVNDAPIDQALLYDTALGAATGPTRLINSAEDRPAGRLWFFEAGNSFVSSNGAVYNSQPMGAGWLGENGYLGIPQSVDQRIPVAHATESDALGKITVVPIGIFRDGIWLDQSLRRYWIWSGYSAADEVALPPFVFDGVAVAPRARFVFYRSDLTKLYVIERTAPDVVPAIFGFSALPP